MHDYYSITEISGDQVSQEQVERMAHRYVWASKFCRNKKVIEVACGAGQGLELLNNSSESLVACDYHPNILNIAQKNNQNITVNTCDAQQLVYSNSSADVIIIFEALYLLPNVEKFIKECARVLKPHGKILIAMANKDLYEFNHASFSTVYFNPPELQILVSKYGFQLSCFGYFPADKTSIRQRILRPIKMIASKLHLIPKSMNGKKLFKGLMFGKLVTMPAHVSTDMIHYSPPIQISNDKVDTIHKVLYAVATKRS